MRLEARTSVSRLALFGAPFGAIVVTLAVCALLVAWAGAPVGRAYLLLLEGGFGSRFAWSETLTRATPLMLTGLAVAVAFRTRLFNIGAEGQLYLGALAAVAVGGQVDGGMPAWVTSPRTAPTSVRPPAAMSPMRACPHRPDRPLPPQPARQDRAALRRRY